MPDNSRHQSETRQLVPLAPDVHCGVCSTIEALRGISRDVRTATVVGVGRDDGMLTVVAGIYRARSAQVSRCGCIVKVAADFADGVRA